MAEKTIEQLKEELRKTKEEAEASKAEAEALKSKLDGLSTPVQSAKTAEDDLNEALNKKVKYTPPLVPGVLEDDLVIIHKGVPYQMARGKECEIPQKVLNVINRANENKLKAKKYAEEQRERYIKAEKMLS